MNPSFEAQVVAAFGRHLQVRDAAGQLHEARPFGRRLEVACGDRVHCVADPRHGEIHVQQVLPRRAALWRSNARGAAELVVANLTLLVVVLAPRPEPDLFVIDRYLAAAASAGTDALLVLNKTDLEVDAGTLSGLQAYSDAGYRIVGCSARTASGLEELRSLLAGQLSVLVGQSGVGKSSLVLQLAPAAQARTGELDRDSEGRHTTTASRLHDLPAGGALIDSPGVRDFAPAVSALEPRSLGFLEIDRLAPGCRFQDCRHLREPGCAVREAVDSGRCDARRYESYRRLRRLYEDLIAARGPGAPHR